MKGRYRKMSYQAEVYELVHKPLRVETMADCVSVYWSLGYTQWHNFPREYFFMSNPRTMESVRLYYNGYVREKNIDRHGCEYHKEFKDREDASDNS